MSRLPLVRRKQISAPGTERRGRKRLTVFLLGFEITSVQSNLEHQHTGGDHHELRQFGLREFFYSQIRAHIVPQAPPPRRGKEAPPWSSPPTLFRATAYATPAVLSLILFILLLGVHHDLGRLRTSLDRCGGGGPYYWANNPAAGVPTVTTVTATVVSSRPTGSGGAADPEWDPDLESPTAAAASDAPGRSSPTSVTMIDVTSPHPTKGDRARPPSGETSVHGEHDALLPMERPLILWPLRLEFPFTREQALEVVEHSLSVAWDILRRLYHFPLDPP